jgi:hypothetical protein
LRHYFNDTMMTRRSGDDDEEQESKEMIEDQKFYKRI